MKRGIATWTTAVAAFASFSSLQAHHGVAYFFDTSRVVTLEGEIVRAEWVRPHRRLFIQSQNEQGKLETWTLWGSADVNGPAAEELKERLQPGVLVVARGFPSRYGALEVGAGEIRLPNGDVEKLGSGPTF